MHFKLSFLSSVHFLHPETFYGLGGTRDPIYFAWDFFKNSLVTQETMRVKFDALSHDSKSPEISPAVDERLIFLFKC